MYTHKGSGVSLQKRPPLNKYIIWEGFVMQERLTRLYSEKFRCEALLNETNIQGAKDLAERLSNKISDLDKQIDDINIMMCGGAIYE